MTTYDADLGSRWDNLCGWSGGAGDPEDGGVPCDNESVCTTCGCCAECGPSWGCCACPSGVPDGDPWHIDCAQGCANPTTHHTKETTT